MGYIPPLPIEPNDAKSIEVLAEDAHRKNVGLTQDLAHLAGYAWAALRWPVCQVLRLVHRV